MPHNRNAVVTAERSRNSNRVVGGAKLVWLWRPVGVCVYGFMLLKNIQSKASVLSAFVTVDQYCMCAEMWRKA